MKTCDRHRRSEVGACMWCGKKVCENCIAKTEGSKLYCEKCMPLIGGLQRVHLPKIGKVPIPAKGRKFVFQDGYLVIDGGAQNGC